MSASSIAESIKHPVDKKAGVAADRGEDAHPHVNVYEVGVSEKEEQDVFAAPQGHELRRMNWKEGAAVVAKAQIGIGILGIPGSFGVLGFVPGLISLLVLCSITTLSSYYIAKIRMRYPSIHSVGDFGYMIGGRFGSELFGWSYCLVFILFAGSAVQTLTIAFNAITLHGLCTVAFAGIVTAFLCVVGSILHEMERVAVLSYVGLACVIIANWILTIAILVKGKGSSRPPGAGNEVKAADTTAFYKAINAVSTQLFALMGTPGFFSVSAEMATPAEFMKSIWVGQGFVCGTYVVIACLVYARAGKWLASPVLASAGQTFKIVCYAIALFGLFISCLLLSHIGAKYIFVRALRGTRHLATATKTHWIVWSACFCTVLILGFILACAIPVFSDLLSLIGALTGGFLVIGLTGLMGLYMLSLDFQDPNTGETVQAPGKTWIQRCYNRAWHHGTPKNKFVFLLSIALICAGAFITGAGTYAAAVAIAKDSQSPSASHAFSCADNSV